jgi:hypothetical protein
MKKMKREMSGIMVIGWDNDFSVKKGFLNYNKTKQTMTRQDKTKQTRQTRQ